ncbi:hypothetical protein EJB05_24826, partial [Eragrostis curvula]
MQGNFLQGTIPSSMERLKGLEVLDLAHNNLSGNIPQFLGRMNGLVSLNPLIQPLRGTTAIEGNQGLCGGISELKLPLFSTSTHTTKKCSWELIRIFISTYADLVHATNGFASENLIGVGSFRSVYRGRMTIHNQQVIIAVKVLQRGLLKVLLRNQHGVKYKAKGSALPSMWLLALDYVHQHRPLPISHCDLKPSNILLDSDFVCNVGGFGLARVLHQDHSDMSEK